MEKLTGKVIKLYSKGPNTFSFTVQGDNEERTFALDVSGETRLFLARVNLVISAHFSGKKLFLEYQPVSGGFELVQVSSGRGYTLADDESDEDSAQ